MPELFLYANLTKNNKANRNKQKLYGLSRPFGAKRNFADKIFTVEQVKFFFFFKYTTKYNFLVLFI